MRVELSKSIVLLENDMKRFLVLSTAVAAVCAAASGRLGAEDTASISGYLQKTGDAEAFGGPKQAAVYLEAAIDLLTRTARKPLEDEGRRLALAAAEAFVSLAAEIEDQKLIPPADQLGYYDKLSGMAPPGTLRDLCTHLLSRAHAARGNTKHAVAAAGRLGVIREFQVIGPFDNERGLAFTKAYPPEEKIDLAAPCAGVKHEVQWKPVTGGAYDGSIDLTDWLYPNQWVTAYILARVEVTKEDDYVLGVSSDDGVVVWVNGTRVIANRARRSKIFDQDTAFLRLSEGTHDLLFKVLQEKGEWSLTARLTPAPGSRARPPVVKAHDGSAPTGTARLLEVPLPADGTAMVDAMLGSIFSDSEGKLMRLAIPVEAALAALMDAGETVTGGIHAVLAAQKLSYWKGKLGASVREVGASEAAVLYFIKGAIAARRRSHDAYSPANPVEELYGKASELWPGNSVFAFHHALSLYPVREMEAEKNYNPFLKKMRRVLEIAPGHAGALASLAMYYQAMRNIDRAYEYADALNDASPVKPFVMAAVSRQAGWNWQVDGLLKPYGDKKAAYVPGIRMFIESARTSGRFEQAYQAAANLCSRAHGDPEAWVRAFEMMISSGRQRDAAALVEIETLLNPSARDILHANLRLAEASKNYAAALNAVNTWLGCCPHDHTLYELLGRYSALVGNKDESLAAYSRALELEPTYTPLAGYMEVFARADDYAAAYLIDTAELAGGFLGKPTEGDHPAEVLVDQAVETIGLDGKASSTIHRVIRLLNPQGVERFGSFAVGYTPGEQDVKVLAARIYRQDGSVDDAKISPPRSRGGRSEYAERVGYTVNVPNPNPGDIVEFRVRIDDRKLSFFGSHYEEMFLFGDTVPVVLSEYVLITPEGYPVSYHVSNGDVPFSRENRDGKTVYRWVLKNVPATVAEPNMPRLTEIVPTVYVSKFSSWKEFGRWYWSLIRDQHTVNNEIKNKVVEITKDKTTTLDKMRAIYHFVTNDIEYVAWEFGVHGFKPYDAGAVLARKFGDCKDKATLMKVMFAQIGIRSYQALVRADSTRLNQDMTLPLFRHFNHAICYVPAGPDYPEMWLDGTAQLFPFGAYPASDGARKSCVVQEEDGGTLLDIPPLPSEQIRVEMDVKIAFQQPQGDALVAVAEISSRARGQLEAVIRHSFGTKPKEMLERIYSRRFGDCRSAWHKFPTLTDMYQPCDYSYGLEMPRMAHREGRGFSVPIFRGFLRPWNYAEYVSLDRRTHALVTPGIWLNVDYNAVITMSPPEGYEFAKLPENAEVNESGARFRLEFARDGSNVVITERVHVEAARINPDDYTPFRNALLYVNRNETQELLLQPVAETRKGE